MVQATVEQTTGERTLLALWEVVRRLKAQAAADGGDAAALHVVHLVHLHGPLRLTDLAQSLVGAARPRIVSDLGGLDKLSWVVTAYLLTSTAVTPLWGKISDLYGRRLIFQAAISIFILGSALSGLAQTMGQLIAF